MLHDTLGEVMGERSHDCYYLVYIGTKPSARGRGYASKLMKDMIMKVTIAALSQVRRPEPP